MRIKDMLFCLHKALSVPGAMDLHKMIINGAYFCPELMKKTIFKISVTFSGNAFIQRSRGISSSPNIRRFIVFLTSYIMHITCKLKGDQKICSSKSYDQKYDFTFFLPKIMFDFHAMLKCWTNILYQQAKWLHYSIFTKILVLPDKRTNKNGAFLYVLTVFSHQ